MSLDLATILYSYMDIKQTAEFFKLLFKLESKMLPTKIGKPIP